MAKKQKAKKVARHRRRKYHEGSHSINKVGRYVPHSPAHSNIPESTLKAMYEMAKGNGSFDGTFAEFQVSFGSGQSTSESNNTSETTQETPTINMDTIYENAVSAGYQGSKEDFEALIGGGLGSMGLGYGNIFGVSFGGSNQGPKLGSGSVTSEDGTPYIPSKDPKRKAPGSSVWDSFEYPEPASVDDLPESLKYTPETTDVNKEEVYATPVTEMKETTKVNMPDLSNDKDEEDEEEGRGGARRGGIRRRKKAQAGGRMMSPEMLKKLQGGQSANIKDAPPKSAPPRPFGPQTAGPRPAAPPEPETKQVSTVMPPPPEPVAMAQPAVLETPAQPTAQATPAGVTTDQVRSLYSQFLGRDPGANQNIQNWVNSGMSIEEISSAIQNSPEGQAYAQANTPTTTTDVGATELSSQVASFYQQYLGRAPQQEYLDQWVSSIADGSATLADVEQAIANSQEAQQLTQDGGGAVTADQVRSLYSQFLGRDPGNNQNIQNWVNSGMSIGEISAAIQNSPEGKAFAQNNAPSEPTTTPALDSPNDAVTVTTQQAPEPERVVASTYDPTLISAEDVPQIQAEQGTVSDEAVAKFQRQELTERAVAAGRDSEQEQAALIKDAAQYDISDGAYVDKVTGKVTDVAPTKEAEVAQRTAIIGKAAEDAEAAQILETLNYEAAQVRAVKGTAAKGAAADMVAEVGELPPELSATIVEDPQTVEAQIDDEPVEVQAAVAALPTEALVSSQMETLLAGIEDGEVPVWARPAVEQVNRMLEQRGLTASTVGRDALLNSIIQSAMPIAQSNAQALQQRAAQNLSNEQQANVQQANLDAQRRLQNTANRQTAASQTAQMAQQMSVLQSQFAQDAMIATAAQAQQTRMANLQNRQQSAIQNVQNQQAINAQNLGNEQQTELANLQFEFQTNAANMSAENQARLVEMQTAADFLAKNAGFKQQMELANLSNEQQMELANLTALNQAGSENLTAEQQTRLANLDSRMKTNMLQAEVANRMNVAQLNADQQRALQNASMVANMDMAQFSADQQVILANSKFMQTMVMKDLDNRQQAVIQNATAMAQLDITNANNQTRIAVENAKSFLAMDMANLNNRQQSAVLNAQMQQQTMLSNQSMANAAKQFNAQSQNQVDQFNASLASQIDQFNASQQNAMNQFNAGEINRQTLAQLQANTQVSVANIGADATISAAELRTQSSERIAEAQMTLQAEQFNSDQDFRRDQFNAANANAIAQADIAWRRQVALAETAAQNAANQQNAQNAFALTMQQQQNAWMAARDEANYLNQQYENEETRKTQLYAVALGNEAAAGNSSSTTVNTLTNMIDALFTDPGGGT